MANFYRPDMASLASARGSTSSTASKQIPLQCSVCPERPSFSDVSHLLTHIASKGHLHHETQTRLKSHQDGRASAALQEYERWYKANAIESLLVERMRAKQLKEAARSKRVRGATPAPVFKAKRKAKRLATFNSAKAEHEDFAQNFPLFTNFFTPSDNETENQDDYLQCNDMLSLKGQVWPGMGKMDLANEDMKRTRNQRKPNSVIEKMQRTSEGIEPTQVVMTSDFEVERVKGVYDSSSPIPGQEATPKKVTKPKRKKPAPLTEISGNVPRAATRRSGRNDLANGNMSQIKADHDRDTSSDLTPSLGAFRHSHDVFRDDDGGQRLYEDRSFTPTHRDHKFESRERLGLHTLNSISHSNLMSPTPSSRDVSGRLLPLRESHRGRTQTHMYLGHSNHMALGSLPQGEATYGLNDASMYENPARLSFNSNGLFNPITHDGFRVNPTSHLQQQKHEDYSTCSAVDHLSNPSNNHFLVMSESNPLFSQDRLFLPPYTQPAAGQSLSSLGFTPINNRGREHGHTAPYDPDQQPSMANVKMESQICDGIEGESPTGKQSNFGMWNSQAQDRGVVLHEDLNDEELDM
ncbi:hypothetical protein DCS_05222 [Drechmeria coniospora]|uniref:Uncharacterized protein n=1 Tax=Drechmeria coniospora TaxID=98403 RepID=A0A151GM79_DRECN|nr:hypothetical protein DCS_05222 [Drechmeria coniospora]KYK58209.1 hypothetical protein DCS_05222 [Drechmeria coniospora]